MKKKKSLKCAWCGHPMKEEYLLGCESIPCILSILDKRIKKLEEARHE